MTARPRNLVDLYIQAYRGQRSADLFVKWSCISGVAACLARRAFWVAKNGDITYPNLYIMMAGESRSGKSWATDKIVERITAVPNYEEYINVVNGKVSFEALIDMLQDNPKYPAKRNVFLAQDEFASDLGGNKDRADHYIKGLTKMYYEGRYDDCTRTHGRLTAQKGYSLNVLWGSTRDWAIRSMPADAAVGGFFPRTNWVEDKDEHAQLFDPPAFGDPTESAALIEARLFEILQYEGQIEFTPEGYQAYEDWFRGYVPPYPGVRYDDWMRKFCIIDAVCDGVDLEVRMTPKNVERAAQWITESANAPVDVLRKTAMNRYATIEEKLSEYIRAHKKVTKVQLMRMADHIGGMHTAALTEYLGTLKEQGKIDLTSHPTGGRPRMDITWIGDDDESTE